MTAIAPEQDSGAKRAWLERVLGIQFAAVADAEPPDLRGRLNETGLRVREMARTEDGPALVASFTEAVNAMKAQDWESVADILDEINPIIEEGLSSARGGEAASVIRAANAWRDACAEIKAAIDGFKVNILSALRAEDEHGPDELDDISDELDARLDPIAARLNNGLADQVDAAINSTGEQQATAMHEVLDRIGKVESEITGDPIIGIVEGNGLEPITIAATALGALAELRKALAERAG
jgi:hypothetical protein